MSNRSKPQPITVSKKTHAEFNTCVHCGICLPSCPTYAETANEADSPRGRIHLMKATIEGTAVPSLTILSHLDRCLVCRACEIACPSAVPYHNLIEAVRPQIAQAVHGRALENSRLEWLANHVLPYPRRVVLSLLPLRIAQRLGLGGLVKNIARRLGQPFAAMTAILPPGPLFPRAVSSLTPALGTRRGSVLLLRGCVGSVVSDSVNAASVAVLARNGFDVHVLPMGSEPCCGAMAAHANNPPGAETFARAFVELLSSRKEDYFISPIAGCAAQLKAFDHVLTDPGAQLQAKRIAPKMREITEFLAEISLRPPTGRITAKVAYHDPCHLLNVQKISTPPRKLLGQIPGVTLVALPETDMCCGAAGTYNLAQPEMAAQLGNRKVGNLLSTGATVCATANVGCQLHMQRYLEEAHEHIPVRHVVELLAESYALGDK